MEKPIALTLEDAEAMVAAGQKAGRVLMVGHLLQYHPAFLKLKELVRDGALGRLRYVYSRRLNLGKLRTEENVLWSFAPHDISMILSLADEEPNEVHGIAGNYLQQHISDFASIHMTFPSGMMAHVDASWLNPFKEQRLVVIGEKAMAEFDDRAPWPEKLKLYRHVAEIVDGKPRLEAASPECVDIADDEPLLNECRHFLAFVARGETPFTDGHEAIRVLKVLRAGDATLHRGPKPAVERPANVMVHESAYVDKGCEIGEGTKIWHFCHLLKGTRIGRNCSLGQNVMTGPDVTIGDNCKIQNNVSLYKGVTLEEGVFCGPSCVFTNVLTPRADVERKDEFAPTLVKQGATIGANATIVCGNTLGRYCTIAAGAVVTRDVLDHALMAGVPARRVGWVGRAGDILGTNLTCPRTGERYRETANGLEPLT